MVRIRYIPLPDRYRDERANRLIPRSDVRQGVDRLADLVSDELGHLTERMLDGDLTLAEWQAGAMGLIKAGHVAAAVVAKGGQAQMTPSDWGRVGRVIRDEYAYLRRFASAVERAPPPSDAQIAARARLYGQGVRSTYEAVRAREDKLNGYDQERNVLDRAAESCEMCVELSALGWVRLGTLPPIGSRTCLMNCRCTIERRMAAEAA